MDAIHDFVEDPRKPRTSVVMVLILLAAMTFSYLAAYAVPDVLVSCDMMTPFPASPDPRPHWMTMAFVSLFGTLLCVAASARLMSSRQLRRIDAMAGEE